MEHVLEDGEQGEKRGEEGERGMDQGSRTTELGLAKLLR